MLMTLPPGGDSQACARERQRRQVRGTGFGSRSKAIAAERETITLDHVRAPNKGGGSRNLAYGYEKAATPSPAHPKRSSAGSQTDPHPLLAPFAWPRRGAAYSVRPAEAPCS